MLKNRQGEFVSAIENVLKEHYNLDIKAAGTPILSAPTVSVTQMMKWAEKNNAAIFFIDIADIFYDVAKRVGVDPAAAYCQSAYETRYGLFGGVLDETYHNPCGMKTAEGGGDKNPNAHMRFDSWQQGIEAQVDHLALYAGANGYPKVSTPDPRHFPFIFQTAQTVEALSGRWAVSPADYGSRIGAMMREVADIQVVEPQPQPPISNEPSDWAKPAWDWAKENKIIVGGEPTAAATREQVVQMLYAALGSK